jgi:hypothetical protein
MAEVAGVRRWRDGGGGEATAVERESTAAALRSEGPEVRRAVGTREEPVPTGASRPRYW